MAENNVIIKVENLTKVFPGIKALDNIQLTLRGGEVHALIGENGAGKSTLVKILTGVQPQTSGTVYLNGKPVTFHNAIEAQEAGIAAIHQEASMFPELSVAENIFMGHHLHKGKLGPLDWKKMKSETTELLKKVGLAINPATLVKNLSVAQRHMIEITKALSMNAQVIIMDEPTSALTNREVEDLYRIIRDLRSEGKAIVFISHKFEEIFEICDYFTVMRDGQYIGEGKIKETSEDQIINMMIGRSIDCMYPEHESKKGDVLLEVNNLAQLGAFKNVSFTLHKGEILGFFGLVGAGRTEVMRTIFGIDEASEGSMKFKGTAYSPRSAQDAMKCGIALVPEDRRKQGIVVHQSITRNISLPALKKLSSRFGVIKQKTEGEYVHKNGTEMEIKAAGYHVDVDTLSGGNQQKVVLAKWLGTKPELLILDEPTRGIDVATKAAVHDFVAKIADQGVGVIVISSELPEVMGMSDRIVVMHEGKMTGIVEKKDATAESIMRYAIGGVK